MNEKELKELLKLYKAIAYIENTKDLIDTLELEHIKKHYQHVYKSCNNFMNRVTGKGAVKENLLLEALFLTEEGSIHFNRYRDALDKTIDVLLAIFPEDYEKLNSICTFIENNNTVVITQKEFESALVDFKLRGLTLKEFLEQWQVQKKTVTKNILNGG